MPRIRVTSQEIFTDGPNLFRPTAQGAKRIFRRFLFVAVGLNIMVGTLVVAYDVADSLWATSEHLRNTSILITKVVQRLRQTTPGSDEAIVREGAIMTRAPLALLSRDGRLLYSSTPLIDERIHLVFPEGPRPNLVIRIDDELGKLSGAWRITPLSSEHNLLAIALRTPEQEGLVIYMTVAAALSGFGIVLSVIGMLLAANWMLRRPLNRLVEQLTSALKDQLGFRSHLINSSEAVGIIATDAAGVIRIYNSAAMRILGHPQDEVVDCISLELLRRRSTPRTEAGSRLNVQLQPQDGEEVWLDRDGREHLLALSSSDIVDQRGSQLGRLVIFLDITLRRRLELDLRQSELQLLQSAKLATLGEMATGVAHELNQPLNNIGLLTSRLQLRLGRLQLDDEGERLIRETTQGVQKQVERASRIIDHLRTFGRPRSTSIGSVALATPVQNVVDLLTEQLDAHGIVLSVDLPAGLPMVRADEGQLEQVVMNLLVNARDALESIEDRPESAPKRIGIRAGTDQFSDGEPAVVLVVEDNGVGIPAELHDRIFEPFFSTKDVGKGTGLGLSISFGLVQGFGGELEVSSTAEQGTRFSVKLKIAGQTEPEGERTQDHGATQDPPSAH